MTRNHVIHIQLLRLKGFAAILTTIAITLKQSGAIKFNLLLGQAIKLTQQKHFRHPNTQADSAHTGLVVGGWMFGGMTEPTRPIH